LHKQLEINYIDFCYHDLAVMGGKSAMSRIYILDKKVKILLVVLPNTNKLTCCECDQ